MYKACDTENAGMVNLGQFTKGINTFATISAPLLEKLFNIMDTNGIGMVDYDKMMSILKAQTSGEVHRIQNLVTDSFDW